MAKMIPPIIDPEIKSEAERTIYRWFEKLEWKNCVILHSLGLARHTDNIFGEIDFVVISTEGILCIEVKGGSVYPKDGVWAFENRYGKVEYKVKGPFMQAQGNMQSLRQHLVKRLAKNDSLVKCQYAACVMTPNCSISGTGPDIIPEVLFDETYTQDDLSKFFDSTFGYWRQLIRSKHGFEGGKLSKADIERAVNLLRGDFRFVPSLSVILNRVDEQLLAVTDEQYLIMEGFDDNDRLLIYGAAGTGKTLLALEQCRRYEASGHKVLYLCYNKLIASYVREVRDKENGKYDVNTLHSLMLKICGETSDGIWDAEYYEKVLPDKFIEIMDYDVEDKNYDVVIIDEGQDLMNTYYYMCISYLIKGGFSGGKWTIYFDPQQNIFNSNNELTEIWKQLKQDAETSYKLTINCRNTRQIAVANKMISNIEQAKSLRAEGIDVEYIKYSSIAEERKVLLRTIRNLRSQGISPGEIVILSAYSNRNNKSCINEFVFPEDLGNVRISPTMITFERRTTDFFTIQSFKGLESKVIIIIDIDDFESEQSRLLNYVAASRARTLLYVFYNVNIEEQRQRMLINGALMK